ncbi:MAG: hypothetical protein BWK80_26615 [Desulfobacteraceae bacterium IS3]|nr:MAG: hypothetical protein BWK80_26615 [Desulfobacteraceae bacterium IS3]
MKILFKFLLLFGKKYCRIEIEGGFKYRIEYKVLFGNEYIIRKTLPPICLSDKNIELPFDFPA